MKFSNLVFLNMERLWNPAVRHGRLGDTVDAALNPV